MPLPQNLGVDVVGSEYQLFLSWWWLVRVLEMPARILGTPLSFTSPDIVLILHAVK